jgi:hypothetical protein
MQMNTMTAITKGEQPLAPLGLSIPLLESEEMPRNYGGVLERARSPASS